jgi:hypothetical protein
MAANVSTAELIRLIEVVDTKLAEAEVAAGDYDHRNYDEWRRRKDAAEAVLLDALCAEGAVFGDRAARDHWVRLAGIRSSSTSGFSGALRNWIAAAQKRVAIGRA